MDEEAVNDPEFMDKYMAPMFSGAFTWGMGKG